MKKHRPTPSRISSWAPLPGEKRVLPSVHYRHLFDEPTRVGWGGRTRAGGVEIKPVEQKLKPLASRAQLITTESEARRAG
jgi:hypothetical protein